ncbi:MAG: DUF1080 domain-containing protein [Acidobacteria bacterium]|nr:DUF1080 domain-containing protein [Acidobacteriota bacterium]
MRRLYLIFLLGACGGFAQEAPQYYHSEVSGDPPFLAEKGWRPLLNGRDLSGWHPKEGRPNEWFTTPSVRYHRVFGPAKFDAKPGPGDRIVNGPKGVTAHLISDEKFGDHELYLEFMLVKASNSGIYLHGLYEVQIFDSFGFPGQLTVGDCGGVYELDDGSGGSPPMHNAARPPGDWQSLHIWFRAPRFDAAGRKTASARILRVLLNDTLVQENVELPRPTRGGVESPEAATNPVLIQGDHGPIALRNIYVRPLTTGH